MKLIYGVAVAAAIFAGGAFTGYRVLRGEESSPAASLARTVALDRAVTDPSVSIGPTTKPVAAKELSTNVKRGLDWLVRSQLESGGWGQGEEAAGMRGGNNGSEPLRDVANVADTSAAALALLRAGSTPAGGPHAANIRRAVDFVCAQVEQADADSLEVTSLRGTRLQAKLGPNIDTFMAALLLAETRNAMPDQPSTQRVRLALDKVLRKIGRNQKDDGSFTGGGWAPVLSQGMFGKAINRAAQNGAKVDEKMRERAESYARAQFDEKTGRFAAGGSAGVSLYAAAANLGAMKDSNDSNMMMAEGYRATLASPSTAPAQRAAAQAALGRFASNRDEMAQAIDAVTARLNDKGFIAGFGSNGGEEFLSYMNIGETLLAGGGETWEKWDKATTENLNRIQNQDGSWSGDHCITGRTFCTSAAILTLTVDRSSGALSGKIKRG